MKRALVVASVTFLLALPAIVLSGPGQPAVRSATGPRNARGSIRRSVPAYRYFYPTYPYYSPYAPPVVISPYGPSYYLPPVVEVTAPFFCLLHNVGFMTRAGMLDHLAGTHKFPLEGAAALCPDGVDSCTYPMP